MLRRLALILIIPLTMGGCETLGISLKTDADKLSLAQATFTEVEQGILTLASQGRISDEVMVNILDPAVKVVRVSLATAKIMLKNDNPSSGNYIKAALGAVDGLVAIFNDLKKGG